MNKNSGRKVRNSLGKGMKSWIFLKNRKFIEWIHKVFEPVNKKLYSDVVRNKVKFYIHKEKHKIRIIAICLLEVDGKQAKSKREQIFNPSISGSQKVSFSCVNNFSIQQCSFQQLISCHKVISEAQVTNES